MFNIFFEPDYALRKKPYFKFPLRKSQFLNKVIQFLFFLKIPVNKNWVTNGPLMRMNNMLINYRNSNNVSINQLTHLNTYIVQFDTFGENILNKIIQQNRIDHKVLVGPLYTINQLKKLAEYTNKYSNIKIVVSNNMSFESIIKSFDLKISKNQYLQIPGGVLAEKDIYFGNQSKRNDKCLIYFKNRDTKDLDLVKKILSEIDMPYELFNNGQYKYNHLIRSAKESKFGIILTTTESQGFGVQELMAQNLPLLVLNSKTNHYEGQIIKGTSVPYWNHNCGIVVDNLKNFSNDLNNFLEKIDTFSPSKFFKNHLTYEKNKKNLLDSFQNF
jgi:hypothetical protein